MYKLIKNYSFFVNPNKEEPDYIQHVLPSKEYSYTIVNSAMPDYIAAADFIRNTEFALEFKCREAKENGAAYPIVTDLIFFSLDAYNGMPGIIGESVNGDLTARELYHQVQGYDTTAYVTFKVGILEHKEADLRQFEATLEGNIVKPVAGFEYNGWEACFQPHGYNEPFMDLPMDVQEDLCIEFQALKKLKDYMMQKDSLKTAECINFAMERKQVEVEHVFLDTDFNWKIFRHMAACIAREKYILNLKCKEALRNGATYPLVTDVASLYIPLFKGVSDVLIDNFFRNMPSKMIYEMAQGWKDQSVCAKYTLGLLRDEDSEIRTFIGLSHGKIVKPKNPDDVGWKACFQPDGCDKPFPELPIQTKFDKAEQVVALNALKCCIVCYDVQDAIVQS